MTELTYFLLGMFVYQIAKFGYYSVRLWLKQRRERQFLKLVEVTFPDNIQIRFIAVEATDKQAMDTLEKQLRGQYHIPVNGSREKHGL